jgi:hypothetical protein
MMTLLANKMNMFVAVMPVATLVFAQGIADRVVSRGYGMNKTPVYKRLKCSVDRHAVKDRAGFFFDISMRQRPGLVEKKLQDAFATGRNAQRLALEKFDDFFFGGSSNRGHDDVKLVFLAE